MKLTQFNEHFKSATENQWIRVVETQISMKNSLIYVIKYLVAWACGLAMIVGLAALIFEDDIVVRVVGGVSALVAVVVGNMVWKKKTNVDTKRTETKGSESLKP